VFAAMAQSAMSNQQSDCPSATNCPNHSQALSDHSTYTTDSAIEAAGFIGGGVLIVARVAMFIVGKSNPAPESTKTGLTVSPGFSHDGPALTLRGVF
jgi:hypothetical protein